MRASTGRSLFPNLSKQDITDRITKADDAVARSVLYEAHARKDLPSLKRWAMAVAKRRGLGRITVASVRKLAIVLHRMRIDGPISASAKGSRDRIANRATRVSCPPPSPVTESAKSVKPQYRMCASQKAARR